jgi:transaldolase
MNRLKALTDQGQAIWLDYIRRDLLEGGQLRTLVERDGFTGLTSNPAIFEKAIAGSALYDEELAELISERPEAATEELYEALAIRDIRLAADLLAGVWERTQGADGYVSLEVSPSLARDTIGTVAAARRLWRAVDRPNLMIKVPATVEGIPAIEALLAEGIHVNVTLMFSQDDYEAVSHAYLRGLERHPHPARVASVASFFVSRVDTRVDAELERIGTPEALALRGAAGIANSKLAYRRFQELFHGEPFAALAARGARPQRVLWASTSTKNPAYRDVLYVEELIGPETVNTLPPETVEAFRDHGSVRPTLTTGVEEAHRIVDRLIAAGVDLDRVTRELQVEGVEKFARPFAQLLAALEAKRASLVGAPGS